MCPSSPCVTFVVQKIMNPKLYLVSTPIGNYDDITIRALEILKNVDFVICEEYKVGSKLLNHYGFEKELINLNEHNEKENSVEIIKTLKSGKSAALISDCGTPLFSDPGHYLFELALNENIEVQVIPGVNSLIPAITGSGFYVESFYYAGWLSPKKDIRRKELLKLRNIKEVIAIMETPYRLKIILRDLDKIFKSSTKAAIAFELTKKGEKFYRGTISELAKHVHDKNLKGEFVLLIDNR